MKGKVQKVCITLLGFGAPSEESVQMHFEHGC